MDDFIHALIDPYPYYQDPVPSTTQLERIGRPNKQIQSHIGDSRVAGWLLLGELNLVTPAVAARERLMLDRYWPFFYQLVHWQGANSAFAGIYAQVSPDYNKNLNEPFTTPTDLSKEKEKLDAFKAAFGPGTVNPEPDLWGFQWYGRKADPAYSPACDYPLDHIWQDIHVLADYMIYNLGIPANKIALMEGGTDQLAYEPLPNARSDFYGHAIGAAANKGLAGVFVWASDSYKNWDQCKNPPPQECGGRDGYFVPEDAPHPNLSLFDVTVEALSFDQDRQYVQ
jgi:hypothetical protein